MSEHITHEGSIYLPIPLDVVLKHVELWDGAYLLRFRDGKLVLIDRATKNSSQSFGHYKEKGVDTIWAKEVDA
jgi:hypothetical protein